MFEETEVCIHCGRPVEGRVYCSSECETLDSASPSISSGASSAYPSPYLTSTSTMNAAGNLDVPALVPSALGHRARYSISSSSNSSTAWSAVTDDEEGDPYVYSEHQGDLLAEGSKSPGFGLFYARRPSSTNHRATVPTLHRHTSATSSSASSFGMSRGFPSPFYASTEDDTSSVCISELSLHDETDPAGARRKAKRTSLPAYFSLLQGSSVSSSTAASPPSTSHQRRTPSALQAISRSLQASPTTPKVSHATVVLANAEAHIESTTAASRGRGRRRERDPDARSASSRRSTARSPPRHLSAAARARLDSVEKVAEWVSSSPVVAAVSLAGRRNSSPQRKPKYEFVEALTRGLRGCAIESDDEDDESEEERRRERQQQQRDATVRGRRRVEELDEPAATGAPGIGSGRSGLKARERGRGVAARAIGLALR